MYHKLTNLMDCKLLIHYLSSLYHGTGLQELQDRLTWTNTFLCTYHTEEHMKDEERGGYILFFTHPIKRGNDLYLHEILDHFHLTSDIAEYVEAVNQASIQDNITGATVDFIEELYIMTDFHLVIMYPAERRDS